MRHILLLTLVLILVFNLADDGRGRLGRAKFNLPNSSVETHVSLSHHSDSDQTDFRQNFASTDLPGNLRHGDTQPVTLRLPATLQIIYCCHLSSSGGIPMQSDCALPAFFFGCQNFSGEKLPVMLVGSGRPAGKAQRLGHIAQLRPNPAQGVDERLRVFRRYRVT